MYHKNIEDLRRDCIDKAVSTMWSDDFCSITDDRIDIYESVCKGHESNNHLTLRQAVMITISEMAEDFHATENERQNAIFEVEAIFDSSNVAV